MGILNVSEAQVIRDGAGNPVPNGKLFVYISGSVSLAPLFQDPGLTLSRENPVTADAQGRVPACHLIDGAYRVVTADSRGTPIAETDGVAVDAAGALGFFRGFETVADLLGDTGMSYEMSGIGGQLVSVGEGLFRYRIADIAATDYDTETLGGVKLYDLQKRTAVAAAAAATAPDGSVFELGGFRYKVDSSVTGTASATYDLGVDGLAPKGDTTPCHFGATGDGTTDDTDAFNRALASCVQLFVPAGTFRIDGTLVMQDNQSIIGAGIRATVFHIGADVTFLHVAQFCRISGFEARPVVAHTVNGIELGQPGSFNASRSVVESVYLDGFGNDNLAVRDDNLGCVRDIVSVNAGRDNIHFGKETSNNNAWKLEGLIDLRGAGRDGLHFEAGASANDANAPKSNSVDFAVAQSNTRYGVFVGSRSNLLRVYGEANGPTDIYIAPEAGGNVVELVEGRVDDQGTSNLVSSHNVQAQFRRSFLGKVLFNGGAGEGWRITNNDGTPGELNFEKVGTREYVMSVAGTGANQTLRFSNAISGFALNAYFDGHVFPEDDNAKDLGSNSSRWKSVRAGELRPGDGNRLWTSGPGDPEGSVSANKGSLYTRTDGGTGATLYVKETGSGSTGWAAK